MSLIMLKCLLLVAFFSDIDREHRWIGFLGPATEKIEAAQLPLTWSPAENIAWESPIEGYGQSSPVVWGDRVYVSSVSGKMKETLHVTALDLATGKMVWNYSLPTKNQGENSDYFSRAAPTPVVSEQGLVVFFENGDLIGLSHEGAELWRKDMVVEHGPITSRHGIASSLAIDGEKVFVWVPRDQQPYIVCIQQKTGEVVWKKELKPGTSWSSPNVAQMPDGSKHLMLSVGGSGGGGPPRGRQGERGDRATTDNAPPPATAPAPTPVPPSFGRLMGLDPATGELLWEMDNLTGNSTPTPTLVKPGHLLIGASAGREGGPSKEAIATNGLVSVEKTDSGWQARYLWRSERATCGFSSPIAHRGHCYFVDRRGRIFCLDVETGKERYSDNLGHPVWATPLAIDDRIYFVGEEGITTVIAASDTFQKLASNTLWESANEPINENDPRSMLGRTRQYAVAAIAGAMFIRRGDRIYCLKIKTDASTP